METKKKIQEALEDMLQLLEMTISLEKAGILSVKEKEMLNKMRDILNQ